MPKDRTFYPKFQPREALPVFIDFKPKAELTYMF